MFHYNFLVNLKKHIFFVKDVRHPTSDVVVEVECRLPQNADYCFFVDASQIIPKQKSPIIIPVVESFKQDTFESANDPEKNPGLLLPKIVHKKLPQKQKFLLRSCKFDVVLVIIRKNKQGLLLFSK